MDFSQHKASNDTAEYVAELEHALAQTRWHLHASQRIAGVGSWQVDMKDWDTVPGSHLWSDEVFRLLGYLPGEVEPSNELFFRHLPAEELQRVRAAIQQSIGLLTAYDIEHQLVRRDGSRVLVRERGEARLLDDGWVRLVGTMQDISVRVEAENYEASLKSIFANTSLAYILLNKELDIVAFNQAATSQGASLLGATLVQGKNVLDYAAPEQHEELKALYSGVVQGHKHGYESSFTTPDGRPFWGYVNLFPVCLDKSNVRGMAISIEDITDRKNADEIIRAKRAKYESFFRHSLDALLLTHYDGPIIKANAAACELFGRAEDELIGMHPSELIETAQPEHQRLVEERRRTGKTRGELSFLRKDGSHFPGIITSVAYQDAGGEWRTSMSVQDITSRKKAEESLRQKNVELRELMTQLSAIREEERTAIAREIHDELGQQLSTLKMGVHRAAAKLKEHELLDDITGSLLSEIDEAIKSVRRIASNLRPIILDYEGLGPALKWYASEFEKLHNIPVQINVDAAGDIDDKRIAMTLFRVLQETFTNIIRHAQAQHICVDMCRREDAIRLTISDDGIGIDLEKVRCKKTFGLVSMKERVTLVGGDYSVGPCAPCGTITEVRVPCRVAP
jgi:PAS domain S-box-containing protein